MKLQYIRSQYVNVRMMVSTVFIVTHTYVERYFFTEQLRIWKEFCWYVLCKFNIMNYY
jgi:hypothetical protein